MAKQIAIKCALIGLYGNAPRLFLFRICLMFDFSTGLVHGSMETEHLCALAVYTATVRFYRVVVDQVLKAHGSLT